MSNAKTNNGSPKGNGESTIPKIDGNVQVVPKNGKQLGGVTGKGFLPGRSGNPEGGRTSWKAQKQFGEHIRIWLMEKAWGRDIITGKRFKRKQPRLRTIIERLAEQRPEILLHYAYGKPVEMHQVEAAEGTTVEFSIKVSGHEVP